MPKLELVFNCLNMFVADDANKVVHVLMPATDGHNPLHRHEVRLRHWSFVGDEKIRGRSMKGWALVLGKTPGSDQGSANTSLVPPQSPPFGEKLVNLSTITTEKVERALVLDQPHPKVAARVSLYGGKVTCLEAEAEYKIDEKPYVLAHQVTWQILDVPLQLEWVALNPEAHKPLESLLEVPTEPNLGYRLEIHHVTPGSLQRGRGMLKPEEMAQHFKMFYPLIGIDDAGDELLPKAGDRTEGVSCGGSGGILAPA